MLEPRRSGAEIVGKVGSGSLRADCAQLDRARVRVLSVSTRAWSGTVRGERGGTRTDGWGELDSLADVLNEKTLDGYVIGEASEVGLCTRSVSEGGAVSTKLSSHEICCWKEELPGVTEARLDWGVGFDTVSV